MIAGDPLNQPEEAAQLSAIQEWSEQNNPETVAHLIQAMAAKSWRVRQAAVAALAQRGGQEVVSAVLHSMRRGHRDLSLLNSVIQVLAQHGMDTLSALCEFLTDPDSELRAYAAIVLGDQNSGLAIPDLMAAIDDADTNVRYHAIEALGKLRAGAAAEKLAVIAESRDFSLAFPALAALASIGDSRVAHRLVPLLDDELLQCPTIETLGQLGDEEIVSLLAPLLNDSAAPTDVIAVALATLHSRYEEAYREGEYFSALARQGIAAAGLKNLIAALSKSAADERRALALVLGWLEGPDVEATLSGLLVDPAVRAIVADAMVRRGSRAIGLLEKALGAEDLETRRSAVLALGRIGDKQAVPALLSALQTDNGLMVAIAGALAMIGDPRAYESLLGFLGHPNAAIRQAVVSAVNAIGHPALATDLTKLLQNADPIVRESAVKIAAYFDFPECVHLLMDRCHDDRENVRRAAVECLPHLEDKRAMSALLAALQDASPRVRAAATRGLGQMDNAQSSQSLQAALKDPDPWVRYYAARSIGRQRGNCQALDVLRRLSRDDNAMQVRVAAVEAIGVAGGPEDIAALTLLAEAADDDMARVALASLGLLAHPAALPPLAATADTRGASRRIDALHALGQSRRPEAVAALRRAASDADPHVAQAAIDALVQLAIPEATAALVELTAVPSRRDRCIAALAGLGEAQVAYFALGLQHENMDVRRSVVTALARGKRAMAQRYLRVASEDGEGAVRFAAISAMAHFNNLTTT